MRERVYRRLATVAAVFVVALVALTGRADAVTYSVSTIAALDAAVAAVNAGVGGDVIVLAPGFYSLTNQLGFNRDVTIQGDASGPTVVDGAGLASAFLFRANASMLNLTIQNASSSISWDSGGIFTGTGLTLTGSRTGLGAGDSEGEIFLTNSTISNNTASGIENSCANLHLTNVTLSGNGRGVSFVHTCSNPVIQFTNALIVANTLDCGGDTAGFNAIGTASIDSDGTCVSRGFGPGMATATVAAVGLGSLAANLGPTLTQAIYVTSAAVDAGNVAACPATDQRGFLRNVGPCDIGAYEFGAGVGGGGNTLPGFGVSVSPSPGVRLTFGEVTTPGDTTATTGGPTPPAHFQVDGVIYDLSTTAGFTGVVTVCLPFNALTNPVPFLFHFEAVPSPPAPFPVPSFPPWINRTASVNTVDHVVCGVVSSLSPFAVLMPADVAGQLQVLHALVESFNLRKPVARRFIHRLGEVREAWVSKHRHHHRTHEFCRELEKFMRDVQKASGRTLTAAEADQLLALAHVIAGDAGCGS